MSELTGLCSVEAKTDDSHVTQVIKIVPVTRDTDGSCTNMETSEHIGSCSSAAITDNSYVTQVIKMVPATRVADSSCTTEYDSWNWFADIKPDSLQDIKEEPKDVRCTALFM